MKTITLTSKGQVTLPAEARRVLKLEESAKLVVTINPENRSITLSRPMSVDELAQLTHALPRKKVKPVMDVGAYYQKHRGEAIR